MTGWLGVNNPNSCCCCELCQPVRCIIDQHEVEIVPATYRSSGSSLAPTTHRSQWSSNSSTKSLPSSRTLVNDDSIVHTRTRRNRLPKSAANHASTGNTHSLSKPGCRHHTHKHGQSASKKEKHTGHIAAVAANMALVHQNEHQSNTHVGGKARSQKSTGSHRPSLASKKLPLEKSPAAGEKLEKHRMKTAFTKNSPSVARRCTSQAIGSDKPFQLFEQDPQHLASLPDAPHVYYAGGSVRSAAAPLGAAFTSALASTCGQLPHVRLENKSASGEGHGNKGQCESESSSDVSSSIIVNNSRTGGVERSYRSMSRLVGSHGIHYVQSPRVELLGPHVSRGPAIRHGGQKPDVSPDAFHETTGLSACAVTITVRANYDEDMTGNRDTAILQRISTERRLGGGCCHTVPTRHTVSEYGGGYLQSGNPAEDDVGPASAGEGATMRKGHEGRHAPGVVLYDSFARAPKESAISGIGALAAEARKYTNTLRLSRVPHVVGSFTNVPATSDGKAAFGAFTRRAFSCPGWAGYGKRTADARTGAMRRGGTIIFPHKLQAGAVASSSRPATAGASTGTCMATCLGRPVSGPKEKNPANLDVVLRADRLWSTRSFPERELFFYDSSFSCADGFACCSASDVIAAVWIAADAESAAHAPGPSRGLQTITQGLSDAHDSEGIVCLEKARQLPHEQKGTPIRIHHAGMVDIALTTAGVPSRKERLIRFDSSREAFCASWQAASKTRQEGEQDRRVGWSPRAPDELGSTAVSEVGRLKKCGWQHQHRSCSETPEMHSLFREGGQEEQIHQQPHLDCASPSDNRRKLFTSERVPLVTPSPNVYPEIVNTPRLHGRCRSAKYLSKELVTRQCSEGASVSLAPAEAQIFSSRDKVTKQVCRPLIHHQRQHLHERGSKKCAQTGSTAEGAEYNGSADIGDTMPLSCIQEIGTGETSDSASLNTYVAPTCHGNATAFKLCTSRRLCPSSASPQRKEVFVESHAGHANSRVCCGVTQLLHPLALYSTMRRSPADATQTNVAQQQGKQPISSKAQQRRTASQQRQRAATRFSDGSPDGCTSYDQSGEGVALNVVPEEVAGSLGLGSTSLSPFSTDVPRTPILRPSRTSVPPQTRLAADSQGTQNHDHSWIVSELSSNSDGSTLCYIRTTSTADSITRHRVGGMTTSVTRSKRTNRRTGVCYSGCIRMARKEGGDGADCSTGKRGPSIRRTERSKLGGVHGSAKAQKIFRNNIAELPEAYLHEVACPCPAFFHKNSSSDLGKASSHQSMLEALGYTQVVEPNTARRFPCTAARSPGDSMLGASSPTRRSMSTFHKDANAASFWKRKILLSPLDKDALLPRWRTRTQELSGKCDVEEKRSKRFLRSKVKCVGKDLRHGFLSKAARLVLWQTGTHLSSATPPGQPPVSEHT